MFLFLTQVPNDFNHNAVSILDSERKTKGFFPFSFVE